jgi:SAM-dependent methyltransferase
VDSPLGTVRFALVTRALLEQLPPRPCRIVDVGGGNCRQAIMLAGHGHEVVVVEPDATMVKAGRSLLAAQAPSVAGRVQLIQGEGEQAADLAGTGFDLACCHSVLMYLDDPEPMLTTLVKLVRGQGLLSVLSLNRDAIAMRSGLQRKWTDALNSLKEGRQVGEEYLQARADTLSDLSGRLAGLGATTRAWYGVRIFTDHLNQAEEAENLDEICELEWLAGMQDPYRSVARQFHLIAERS